MENELEKKQENTGGTQYPESIINKLLTKQPSRTSNQNQPILMIYYLQRRQWYH